MHVDGLVDGFMACSHAPIIPMIAFGPAAGLLGAQVAAQSVAYLCEQGWIRHGPAGFRPFETFMAQLVGDADAFGLAWIVCVDGLGLAHAVRIPVDRGRSFPRASGPPVAPGFPRASGHPGHAGGLGEIHALIQRFGIVDASGMVHLTPGRMDRALILVLRHPLLLEGQMLQQSLGPARCQVVRGGWVTKSRTLYCVFVGVVNVNWTICLSSSIRSALIWWRGHALHTRIRAHRRLKTLK